MPRKRHDDGGLDPEESGVGAGAPSRVVSPVGSGERDEDAALRPRSFAEFVGQRKVAENMAVYVEAARRRGDALDHVLFSGPALERKGDLAGLLTSLGRGDILFIDEIHRLQPVIEESLYPAMEDFRIELLTGTGAGARAINLPIERFTLVGATTRTGQLGSPLLDRFGIRETFEFYSPEELTAIVRRSARLLGIAIDDAGAEEIGRRARGTPRVANRLLRRI